MQGVEQNRQDHRPEQDTRKGQYDPRTREDEKGDQADLERRKHR